MKALLKIASVLSIGMASNLYAITLDGQLNDPEWQEAALYTDFITVQPFSLTAPEYKTEARIFTNDAGIYVGITNHQPLVTQRSERTARNTQIKADQNAIIIDFDNTGVAAYSFEVGNGGSMRDGIWRNETEFNNEWNGIWSLQTSSDEGHWYAEVFIPWDVAPMVKAIDGQRSIGLYISRQVATLSKTYASAAISDDRQRFLSEFNSVTIKDFASSSLQVFPYVSARQDRVAEEEIYNVGVDIFWKPSSSKQLSVSINPDFGHVDTDNLVVNFSPTETFFSENRPFFTENQAIFDLNGANGLRLIHTRRIGGRPDVGDEIGADIQGALKFTSVGEKFNYGFFTALEDNDAQAQGRNYYAGRVVRKTDDYSLGYLLTYTDRPDIDRDATVQTVDYSYFFSQGIQLNGQLINSSINVGQESYSDNGGWFSASQQINVNWLQSIELSHYGDQFDVNDLGFLGRNDLRTVDYSTSWKRYNFANNSGLNEYELSFSMDRRETIAGEHLGSTLFVSNSWRFKNTAWTNWRASYDTEGIDDLLTRGNQHLKTDSGKELDAIFFADNRGKFTYHLHGTIFDRPVGGQGYLAHFHPEYQFNDKYLLRFGLTYTDSDDWLIWQQNNDLNSYHEKRLFSELAFTATLSEKQEFSLKFEWIALSAKGGQSYRVGAGGDLFDLNNPVDDFSLSDTAIQLRYRYEIAPLSNIYVVYSRGGRAVLDEESSFGDLFSPGWDARDGDNFLVKIRYQF